MKKVLLTVIAAVMATSRCEDRIVIQMGPLSTT